MTLQPDGGDRRSRRSEHQPEAQRPAGLQPEVAGETDVADLVELVQSAYRGEESKTGWTTEAELLDGQRLDAQIAADMIADPTGAVLLLRDELGKARACVQLRDLGDHVAYFGTFAVSPRAQGRGVGRQVMTFAEDFARSRFGAARMRMTVIDKRAELISFYERCGYVLTGEKEPFPYGDERFGIPRTADLEFAVLVKELGERTG